MGEVVRFRLRERKSHEKSGPPTGGAQILFFLGVRYMRTEESLDARGGASPTLGRGPSSGRKRKRRA
jgi:hypothetical protein